MASLALTNRLKLEIEGNPLVDKTDSESIEPWQSRSKAIESRRTRMQHLNGTHAWRKHEREAKRSRRVIDDTTYKIIPIGDRRLLLRFIDGRLKGSDVQYKDEDRPVIMPRRLKHTNEILNYFGFREDGMVNAFLRGFNGDYQHGADVVRVAYRLADSYGLKGDYDGTSSETKEAFMMLSKLVHMHGVERVDSLLTAVGITKVAQFQNYLPLNITGNVALVPATDLDSIVLNHGQIPLKSSRGQLLLKGDGYQLRFSEGIQVYEL